MLSKMGNGSPVQYERSYTGLSSGSAKEFMNLDFTGPDDLPEKFEKLKMEFLKTVSRTNKKIAEVHSFAKEV